jgi:hypothetical protein
MSDNQPRKFLKAYQKTKIDTTGWASEGGPSRKVLCGEPGVWRDQQKDEEEEVLRKEEESVATKLRNEARLLANVEMLQQELIERQQVIIGYQQSIRRNVVTLSEYQTVLRQRKVAVGEGWLMDIGTALRGGWVPSTPEHEGEEPVMGTTEEAAARTEGDSGRSREQKKTKTSGRGGMVTWAELLARPMTEAFGIMVHKFKSTPDVLRVQETGMTDEACAQAYVKNKKVCADLIGPYVQARRELRNETVAWARSVEPVVEVAKDEAPKTGRDRHGERRGAWCVDSSEEGE